MRYVVNPMFARGLGATSDGVSVDTGQVLSVGDQLRQAQADLAVLVQAMQADPTLASVIGPSVVKQQSDLGDLISKYVYVYTAIFGQRPAGLGQVLVIAAVAAAFVVVVTGLAVWWEHESAIKQQAQAATTAANNQAALIGQAQGLQAQASAAAAAGDAATAKTLQDQANQLFVQAGTPGGVGPAPPPPGNFVDWLKNNWTTAALIAGGIYVLSQAV